MIGKVKKWLGIEGVRMELLVSELFNPKDKKLSGALRFYSKTPQRVTGIKVSLIERYGRGRGTDRLIDEYILGHLEVETDLRILPDQLLDLPFTLEFSVQESRVDQLERSLLWKGVARLAKFANQVKSEYRLEAEARVEGTALHPLTSKPLTANK